MTLLEAYPIAIDAMLERMAEAGPKSEEWARLFAAVEVMTEALEIATLTRIARSHEE